jgi:hypothetical protein
VSSASCTRGAAAARRWPARRSGSHTLSCTLAHGISVGSWKTKATSPPAPCGTATVPLVGTSSPADSRSTVLLPHPEAPSSDTNSPGSTRNDTPRTASRPES